MHGLAMMATNLGTHDADYNTNTGTDHKECVKHACIYPCPTYECDHMPSLHACDINLPSKTDCKLPA